MAVIKEFEREIITIVKGAFAFVAAFVWRDAIMAWMSPLLDAGKGAVPLTLVAILITIIASAVILFLGNVSMEKRANKKKK